MCSVANTISQRAEKVMYRIFNREYNNTFLYQRNIVCPNSSDIRVTENSIPGRKNLEIL